jgi:hypothetical protein
MLRTIRIGTPFDGRARPCAVDQDAAHHSR